MEEDFRVAVEDMRQTLVHGAALDKKPTLHAAVEFSVGGVEPRDPDVIGARLKAAVSFINIAVEEQEQITNKVFSDCCERFGLSAPAYQQDAQAIAYALFLLLERALAGAIRDAVRNSLSKNAALCDRWLKTLAAGGHEVQLHRVALRAGTGLLGVRNPEARTGLYEETIAMVLKQGLGAAHAVGKLDDAAVLLADLAEEQITGDVDEGYWDKDAIKRVFLLTLESLGEPDAHIRRALLKISGDLRKLDCNWLGERVRTDDPQACAARSCAYHPEQDLANIHHVQ